MTLAPKNAYAGGYKYKTHTQQSYRYHIKTAGMHAGAFAADLM